MKPNARHLIESIPDWTNGSDAPCWAQRWMDAGLKEVQNHKSAEKSASLTLEFEDIYPLGTQALEIPDNSEQKNLFGLYSSADWRRFVLAVFLADAVSYPRSEDQVSFERLAFVMHRFPQGFKVWWSPFSDSAGQEVWWPVGYTGWYPMLESVFNTFEKNPESLVDRTVIPCPRTEGDRTKSQFAPAEKLFLYLFNYSVAPAFKKTQLSKRLMKDYSTLIHSKNAQGLACITVSDDGARIANRFGMLHSGNFKSGTTLEGVYTKRIIP